jgi:hypothetical protein
MQRRFYIELSDVVTTAVVFAIINIIKLELWLQYGCNVTKIQVRKGKAIPLQAWTGHEGSRRLRLPDFKIFDT